MFKSKGIGRDGVLDRRCGDGNSIALVHQSFADFVDPDAVDARAGVADSAAPIDIVFVEHSKQKLVHSFGSRGTPDFEGWPSCRPTTPYEARVTKDMIP